MEPKDLHLTTLDRAVEGLTGGKLGRARASARITPPENMTLSDLSARKQERFARSSIAQAKSVGQRT